MTERELLRAAHERGIDLGPEGSRRLEIDELFRLGFNKAALAFHRFGYRLRADPEGAMNSV